MYFSNIRLSFLDQGLGGCIYYFEYLLISVLDASNLDLIYVALLFTLIHITINSCDYGQRDWLKG